MDELISKKKAIEKLNEWQNTHIWDSWCLKYEDDPKENIVSPVKVIENLPSAEPERKKGEWIQRPRYDGDTQPMLECPYCQNKVGWWDLARYCDSCGARLKGSAGDLDE